MNLSLTKNELKIYMKSQLDFFFPDKYKFEGSDIDRAFELGLEKLEFCFKFITFPEYCDINGQTYFSHLHADQYAQFLYFFSSSLWKLSENKPICDKLIQLNRVLNSFFFSYKGALPDIFFLGHPVGTVLGNAVYSNFLVVFQHVTINTSMDDKGNTAPVIGPGLFCGTGATIIGNKPIGKGVSIGVNTTVYNSAIDDNKVVSTNVNGELIIKDRSKEKCMAQNYFNVDVLEYVHQRTI